jgi:hypothetical protein
MAAIANNRLAIVPEEQREATSAGACGRAQRQWSVDRYQLL